MNEKLNRLTERVHIYQTASTCPFCGGTMLPLLYIADVYEDRTTAAYLYDGVYSDGNLKACNRCGIVKFYPDGEKDGV